MFLMPPATNSLFLFAQTNVWFAIAANVLSESYVKEAWITEWYHTWL